MLRAGAASKHAGYAGYKSALAELWRLNATLREELAVVGGYALRERSAGRLDLQLPWESPWCGQRNETPCACPYLSHQVLLGETQS